MVAEALSEHAPVFEFICATTKCKCPCHAKAEGYGPDLCLSCMAVGCDVVCRMKGCGL